MAAEGYNHHEESMMNHRAVISSSGAAAEMIPPMGLNYYGASASATGMNMNMMLPIQGNSPTNSILSSSAIVQPGNCSAASSPLLLDSVPAIRQETGLAAEWSVEEQYRLEEGLEMFANEPSILKYIKIAAHLRDKTVRDVALRCRWMTRKRRKPEEHNMGKKVNIRKDKLAESSSKATMPSAIAQNMVPYPPTAHHMDQNEHMLFEVSGIGGTARHLLEQNAQDIAQIRDNISSLKTNMRIGDFAAQFRSPTLTKLQDNIQLLYRTRNNLTAIINDMQGMPGIMSQMPPLPVSINEDLANSILPSTTQSMIFGSPSGVQMKQEPR